MAGDNTPTQISPKEVTHKGTDATPPPAPTAVTTPAEQRSVTATEQKRVAESTAPYIQPMNIDGQTQSGKDVPAGKDTPPSKDAPAGKDAPLATKEVPSPAPAAATDFNGATEIVKGADGKDTTVPLTDKLKEGDHTIQLQDGRQFIMHVPANDGKTQMPVMFVFSGSAHGNWDIKDFIPESGMNKAADDPNHKFIAVYPLPEKHLIGVGDTSKSYAWNAEGSLIPDNERKAAGYDDTDFVKSVVDLVPKLGNVDATHKNWGAMGWSQGGPFLNSLVAREPNLFPTVGLVGSSMQLDYTYKPQPGNAMNVDIVNLRGDKTTMPFTGLFNESATFVASEALRKVLPESVLNHLDTLSGIQNEDQDPMKQEAVYKSLLGNAVAKTDTLNTPVQSWSWDKDTTTSYKSADPTNKHQLVITDLAEAQHSYPAPDPSGARTNATEKYTEFDNTTQFVKLFNAYNDSLSE